MRLSYVFLFAVMIMFSVSIFANAHVHGHYSKDGRYIWFHYSSESA